MSKLLVRVSALLLGLTLAACSSLEPVAPIGNTDFQTNERALLAHQNWTLIGKLSVRQSRQSDTVSINWLQQSRQFDITLRGALGIGSTRVFGNDHGLTLQKSGEQPVTLPSLEALTRDYLDFEFPAAYLLYWVRGLPVPGIPATTEFDANSRLVTLSQRDNKGRPWQLTFDSYSQVQDSVLPGLIKLKTADIQLTFRVTEWQFNAAQP